MATGTKELLATLKVDPKFRDKIPPLTPEEFKQLRENILEAGEVYEPIRLWNGTVVDGHNRLKVIRENPGIVWHTKDMEFADEWAAFDWMYRNQLGRRNLTDEQRTYMIGKMYEARKKSSGGQVGNDNAIKRDAQNGQFVSNTDKKGHGVSGELAIELNVGRNTVRRAEKFAKGVDVLRKISPESADVVLKGKAKLNKGEVAAIATADPDVQKKTAEAIVKNETPQVLPKKPEPKPKPINNGRTAEMRELFKTIEDAAARTRNVDMPSTYDIDSMCEELRGIGEMCISSMRGTIDGHRALLVDQEAKNKVFAAIAEVIQGITKMRGEVTK